MAGMQGFNQKLPGNLGYSVTYLEGFSSNWYSTQKLSSCSKWMQFTQFSFRLTQKEIAFLTHQNDYSKQVGNMVQSNIVQDPQALQVERIVRL